MQEQEVWSGWKLVTIWTLAIVLPWMGLILLLLYAPFFLLYALTTLAIVVVLTNCWQGVKPADNP